MFCAAEEYAHSHAPPILTEAFLGKTFLISRNDGRLHSDFHLLPFPRLYNPILSFRLESLVGGDFVLMTVA